MNSSSCSGDVSRMSERNACASGPNGRPSPPISTQLPASTLAPAALRALGGLLDEPRLAHAGLAAQEHHRRVARDRSVERRGQRRQLGVSADEHRD